jgi:hypothetical protein
MMCLLLSGGIDYCAGDLSLGIDHGGLPCLLAGLQPERQPAPLARMHQLFPRPCRNSHRSDRVCIWLHGLDHRETLPAPGWPSDWARSAWVVIVRRSRLSLNWRRRCASYWLASAMNAQFCVRLLGIALFACCSCSCARHGLGRWIVRLTSEEIRLPQKILFTRIFFESIIDPYSGSGTSRAAAKTRGHLLGSRRRFRGAAGAVRWCRHRARI